MEADRKSSSEDCCALCICVKHAWGREKRRGGESSGSERGEEERGGDKKRGQKRKGEVRRVEESGEGKRGDRYEWREKRGQLGCVSMRREEL